MITINKTIGLTASPGATSFSYTLTSSDPCLSITPTSGDVDGSSADVNINFEYTSEACFDGTTITINILDNKGCSQDLVIALDNPCSTYTVQVANQTENNNPFVFVPAISGGTPSYTYSWVYDNNLFTRIQDGDNRVLRLELNDGVPVPLYTSVTCLVSDAFGCQASAAYTYYFNAPTAFNTSVSMQCVATTATSPIGNYNRIATNVVIPVESSSTLDWTGAAFDTPAGVALVAKTLSDGSIAYDIYASPTVTGGNKAVTYSVPDQYGIISNNAVITLVVPTCPSTTVDSIAGIDKLVSVGDTTPGHQVYIPLSDDISDAADWSTFTFVAALGQTLVSADELTTANGSAKLTMDREVEFTVGTVADAADLVQYKIDDTDGQVSAVTKLAFDLSPTTAPSVSTDAVTVAAGQSAQVDLLANDTGDIDPNSVQIVSSPSVVSYVIDSTGKLTVTAAEAAGDGSDSLTYKVANTNGVYSSAGTVNITIISAGIGTTTNLCAAGAVNLETKLTASPTSGGSWTQSGSNPSTLVLTDPTNVDFTGANNGTYRFTYTVTSGGETDTATVTILYQEYSVSLLSTVVLSPAGTDPNTIRAKFKLTGQVPIGNIFGDIHKDTSPITPGAGNLIDVVTPIAYDPGTGVITLDTQQAIDSDAYMVVARIVTPCGTEITANSSNIILT